MRARLIHNFSSGSRLPQFGRSRKPQEKESRRCVNRRLSAPRGAEEGRSGCREDEGPLLGKRARRRVRIRAARSLSGRTLNLEGDEIVASLPRAESREQEEERARHGRPSAREAWGAGRNVIQAAHGGSPKLLGKARPTYNSHTAGELTIGTNPELWAAVRSLGLSDARPLAACCI
jgi:hypothetical protein